MTPRDDYLTSGDVPVWWVLVVCAVVALSIDLGRIHWRHDGDTLVPILASLYYWTPFFWEQNRFGMLVPLITSPIKNPLANLLVQTGLNIFAGLTAMFLLARYLLRDATWPVVGAVSIAALLALTPPGYHLEFMLGHQPYAVGLALCLGGLLLAESLGWGDRRWTRLACALVLVVLAHWVNFGTAILIGPVVLFRAFRSAVSKSSSPDPSALRSLLARLRAAWSESGVALVVLAVGFVVGIGLMRVAPYRSTRTRLQAPGEWVQGAWRLAYNTWVALESSQGTILFTLAIVGGILLLSRSALRRQSSAALEAAAALTATALTYALLLASVKWVADNEYAYRYCVPSVVLLMIAAAAVGVTPLYAVFGTRGWKASHAVLPLLLLAAVVYSDGSPSLRRARADLDWLGGRTADVLAAHATHVAGSYWTVWPTVFHANLVLYEQSAGRVIWGISYRSQPSRHLWREIPPEELRVAVPPGDPEAYPFLRMHRLTPLVVVEKRPRVWILRPKGTPGPGDEVFAPLPDEHSTPA